MRVIAWHLPQFHSIAENDEWWGKGFTEWTNVKKAKPLFKGHNQPKKPLEDNYYNLLEKEVMIWQNKISEKYGIYGFCYYHYWFNGKLLLEKPLENLIKWKDIPQKFCLSWANEPWARTWDGQNKKVLMPQTYGNEKEWENHFYYLLKFFKDERYIKIENKPLFLIYRTENIPRCNDMIKYWNKLAQKNGLEGIHLIETLNSFQSSSKCSDSNGVVYMEPMVSLREIAEERSFLKKIKDKMKNKFIKPRMYEYEKISEYITNRNYKKIKNKNQYLGTFVSWDNTARKGKNGMVIKGAEPEKFKKCLIEQKKNLEKLNEEILFINAWNEWAEGTYLEPDQENGYEYLEKIKDVIIK